MSSPFQKKEPPISHAERPRLQRAMAKLADDQRASLLATINEHQENLCMKTLQRRGASLAIVAVRGGVESETVYDFGDLATAQSALTALTDCLRTERRPVRLLPATS